MRPRGKSSWRKPHTLGTRDAALGAPASGDSAKRLHNSLCGGSRCSAQCADQARGCGGRANWLSEEIVNNLCNATACLP
jgi:hypothetical protein